MDLRLRVSNHLKLSNCNYIIKDESPVAPASTRKSANKRTSARSQTASSQRTYHVATRRNSP